MTPASRTILHVDMDAFYAAVEQRDDPSLAGRPVVVGGSPDRRGVVSAASYEARRYGVHSAMPTRTAHRLCPDAVFVPVRMDVYQAVSRQVMRIFADVTPVVEPLSIDEAFLDVAGVLHLGRDAVELGEGIRRRVRDELRLTCSVGVAVNKFLAKLASGMRKPDALTVVPETPAAIAAFLAPLDVAAIWGVGKVTQRRLRAQGIETVADLQRRSLGSLQSILGSGAARHVLGLAHGRDDRCVTPDHEEKSISNETTFDVDCDSPERLAATFLRLTENVGRRLRSQGKCAETVQIKVRFADFSTLTRQCRCDRPTNSDRDLYRYAQSLMRKVDLEQPVRLLGFGATGLAASSDSPVGRQGELFAEHDAAAGEAKDRQLHQAIDRIRDQFGRESLKRGGLMSDE